MKDVFGNFVIQKVLEFGPIEHIQALFEETRGNILDLSKHIYGCRVIQKFIQVLDLDSQKEIITEVESEVMTCIFDLYGNHVVQKLIEKVPYNELSVLQTYVATNCRELCMHIYGCRVIQRILEHCSKEHTDLVYDHIVGDHVAELSKDQFGNYVIQLILEKWIRKEDRKAIWLSLLGDARVLSVHKYTSNVVEKCIQFWEKEDKALIITELLGDPDNCKQVESLSIYKMMDNKYGNYVVQKALEEASEDQRLHFYNKIKSCDILDPQPSNYVKHVINCLDRLSLSEA
jgi:pumilio RNA-binding family